VGLGLDRVVGEVQPFADLRKGEVGGQQRQQPQLGGGQRRGPHGPAAAVELGPQLVDLGGEDAEVGPQPEDVAGLAQHRPGAGVVVQGQAGAAQFQQGLDRQVGQGVGEQGPQAGGPRQLFLSLPHLALVYGQPGRHGMD
jgi:hypothetical protein